MLNNDSESKPTSSFHRGEGHIAREKWLEVSTFDSALFTFSQKIHPPTFD